MSGPTHIRATLPGLRVAVEVTITRGMPSFTVGGAPDITRRELRERVRAGVLNAGYEFPAQNVVVDVLPELERSVWNRHGDVLTYWIARALLDATGQAPAGSLEPATLSIGGVVTLPGGERVGLRDLIAAESSDGGLPVTAGYVVTVTRERGGAPPLPPVEESRHEVDTLLDVAQLVWDLCRASLPALVTKAEVDALYRRVANGGMGDGPLPEMLPDGSSITVERKGER